MIKHRDLTEVEIAYALASIPTVQRIAWVVGHNQATDPDELMGPWRHGASLTLTALSDAYRRGVYDGEQLRADQ